MTNLGVTLSSDLKKRPNWGKFKTKLHLGPPGGHAVGTSPKQSVGARADGSRRAQVRARRRTVRAALHRKAIRDVLVSSERADAHGVFGWRRLRLGRRVHRDRSLVLHRVHHPPARTRAPALRAAFAVARYLLDRAHARLYAGEVAGRPLRHPHRPLLRHPGRGVHPPLLTRLLEGRRSPS